MKVALVMASASFLPHEKISIREKVLDDQKFESYLNVKLNGSRYRSRLRYYDLFHCPKIYEGAQYDVCKHVEHQICNLKIRNNKAEKTFKRLLNS